MSDSLLSPDVRFRDLRPWTNAAGKGSNRGNRNRGSKEVRLGVGTWAAAGAASDVASRLSHSCMCMEPPLLLCEEPMRGFERDTGRQVRGVLCELARERHKAVLLVTHNPAITDLGSWSALRMQSETVVLVTAGVAGAPWCSS